MVISRLALGHIVLPLFTRDRVEGFDFLGTSFVAAPGVLVTCWHCVEAAVHAGKEIGVVAIQSAGLPFLPVRDVAQDANGSDLATARTTVAPVGHRPRLEVAIASPTDV